MKEETRFVSIKQLFTAHTIPHAMVSARRWKNMCQERPKDWDRYLPAMLFAYREAPQASTGCSPFELLYRRTVHGPMQVLNEIWTEAETPETQNTYQYVLDLSNRPEATCQIARERETDGGQRRLKTPLRQQGKMQDLQSRAKGFADGPQHTPTSAERSCRSSRS